MCTFTVFTPTFNRAHTLARVYDSLCKQTYRNFEWVVVDDGSTDGTREKILLWSESSDFTIRYYYQENAGKHIAINRAVAIAAGELFLIADSDDAFVANALERMLYWWNSIAEKDRFTGIVTLSIDENGVVDGSFFPESPLDTDALALEHVLRCKGERWGFHRTAVLQEFPFPENRQSRFVPENLIWGAIARKYKIRCVNEAMRIYFHDSGNQITKSSIATKSVVAQYFGEIFYRDFDYFLKDPIFFIKYGILFIRYSLHVRHFPKLFDRHAQILPMLMLSLLVPCGVCFYVRDILRFSRT